MRRGLMAAVLAVALVSPGLAQAAKPARIFAQAGKGIQAQKDDETVCADYAKGVSTPGLPPPVVTSGGVAAAAGAGLATGFLAGLEQARARLASYERCMKARGYVRVTLDPAEEASLRAAKPQAAREAWFAEFMAKPGLGERIAATKAASVELPPIPERAVSSDGLAPDLARAKTTEGAVAEGGTLLAMPAAHLATARLVADYPVSNMLGVNKRGESGAVFHAVARGPYVEQWCGPFVNNSIKGRITLTGCVDAVGDDFKVSDVDGEPWLAGVVLPSGFKVDDPPRLEPSDTDLIGPVDLTLVLDKITKKGVRLKLVAAREGEAKTVTVWRGGGDFDAEGRFVVPLWTHSLVLVRQDAGVAATLAANGDGRGWWSAGAP